LSIATNERGTDDVVLWMHSGKCCTDARVESMPVRPPKHSWLRES
jgi:hypothetical protein